jgi:hypothetical protein
LDIVEGSTPSKTEKETEGRAGAGNVEAPASTTRERERERELWMHLGDCNLIRVPLGTSACKEGVVVMVEEGTPKERKNPGHRKRTCHEQEPSGKKER